MDNGDNFVFNNVWKIKKSSFPFCIILTSFCTPERIPMYRSRVNRWINETPYDIYLVDSNNTGLGLKGPRYTEVLFNQYSSKWFINGKKAGGFIDQSICETESMKYIINKLKLHEKYEYIFKITAKYFIPQFNILETIPKNRRFILQFRRCHPNWHNTEIYGVSSKIIIDYLDQCPKYYDSSRKWGVLDDSLETYMFKISRKYGFLQLPPLKLDMLTQRADGSVFDWL